MYRERIKGLREEKNLIQKTVASDLNLSESHYATCECELDIFPLKHLNNLCTYFDVSLDYVFGFTDIKKYENLKSEIDLTISAKRLKEFRKSLNKTLEKFGDLFGISYGTVAGYEKGRYLIATSILFEICRKYGISADYLLGKTD